MQSWLHFFNLIQPTISKLFSTYHCTHKIDNTFVTYYTITLQHNQHLSYPFPPDYCNSLIFPSMLCNVLHSNPLSHHSGFFYLRRLTIKQRIQYKIISHIQSTLQFLIFTPPRSSQNPTHRFNWHSSNCLHVAHSYLAS